MYARAAKRAAKHRAWSPRQKLGLSRGRLGLGQLGVAEAPAEAHYPRAKTLSRYFDFDLARGASVEAAGFTELTAKSVSIGTCKTKN